MITWPTSMLWTPGPPPDMATVIPTGPEERCCKDAYQYKVLVCHGLSLFVTVCHCLSLIVTTCHNLSQLVRGCHSLQRVVRVCHKLSQLVRGCQNCHSLTEVAKGYLERSRVAIVVLVLSAKARWPGVVGGPCKEGWGGRCCKDQDGGFWGQYSGWQLLMTTLRAYLIFVTNATNIFM